MSWKSDGVVAPGCFRYPILRGWQTSTILRWMAWVALDQPDVLLTAGRSPFGLVERIFASTVVMLSSAGRFGCSVVLGCPEHSVSCELQRHNLRVCSPSPSRLVHFSLAGGARVEFEITIFRRLHATLMCLRVSERSITPSPSEKTTRGCRLY